MESPEPTPSSHNNSLSYLIRHFWYQEVLVIKLTAHTEKIRLIMVMEWLKQRTPKQYLLAGGLMVGAMLIGSVGLTLLFASPRTHTYSYSGNNCFFNPVFLPSNVKSTGSETYQSNPVPKISIGNTPLISTTTCLELNKIPEEKTQDTLTMKTPVVLQKNITLTPEQLPSLKAFENLDEPLSREAVLLFYIDKSDKTFSYTLQINDKTSSCILYDTLLGCPLASHSLGQGQSYTYTVNRVLGDQSDQAISGTLSTLDPVIISSSGVANNENVYTKPTSINLSANKTLKSVSGVSLKSTEAQTDYPVTTAINDTSLILNLSQELPRNTNFTLSIDNIVSSDGATLSEPYTLNFKTSAGPQVQSSNIGAYKVSTSGSFTIKFDVELDPSQRLSDYVKLQNGSEIVGSNITVQNNSITINPTDNLSPCTSYTISVGDGLLSKFGVSGGSAWSTQTRTICQQVFSIGNSVQGRGITAYKFGNGATKIVFIGGLHGNEKSSVLTLNSWIDELERNYQNIPADKTVVVIPNTNPDAYNASSRLNANGIDLNRNFPSNNWQSGVFIPGGTYLENGGGANALSEPESSTVANYLTNSSPRLVLTYHATAGAVIFNGAGDSSSLSAIYSDKSGYGNYDSAHEDGIFNYPTTGEMEDWLRDKRNVPTLLVELATQYSNNFTRQKSAMWAMLSL